MSPTLAPAGRAWLFGIDGDRRSHRRYPIVLEVEYKLLERRRAPQIGSGRTINISTSGILFEAKDIFSSTGPIELTLNWPFLLDGVCPLKLVIQGRVVRNSANRIAVCIKHHELHTAGSSIQKPDLSVRF